MTGGGIERVLRSAAVKNSAGPLPLELSRAAKYGT